MTAMDAIVPQRVGHIHSAYAAGTAYHHRDCRGALSTHQHAVEVSDRPDLIFFFVKTECHSRRVIKRAQTTSGGRNVNTMFTFHFAYPIVRQWMAFGVFNGLG